jgi:hypothetical protein
MSEREEVVPRYRSASPPYYREDHENEEFEQRAQNFKPSIHYVVKQEVVTQGIKMSKRVEPILVTKQETIVLPRTKPTIIEGIPIAIRMRYSEMRLK